MRTAWRAAGVSRLFMASGDREVAGAVGGLPVAKRKKANPWDAVFERVVVRSQPEHVYVKRPTESELDALEMEIGSRLPASYRAFMLEFGPGQLNAGTPDSVKLLAFDKVARRTRELRDFFDNDPSGQPRSDWLASLVVFGTNCDGDEYTLEPTGLLFFKARERYITRLPRGNKVNPLAESNSFPGFIDWVATGADPWLDEPLDEVGANIWYDRLHLRTKKSPVDADVKLWLAFNNTTVRNLALSIRDEKRPDAFPILADALEEAGCTNADMLESCRRGDPDIDGLWVLRVLLGT